MTQIEDRVRSGLQAEADALARARRTAQPTLAKPTLSLSGAAVAVAVGAAVLVVFGGISLFTGGGGGAADQPAAVPTASPTTSTSAPSTDTALATIGAIMGGEPLQGEELERITGSAGSASSGYLIESTTALDGAYELGLIVYQEGPLQSGGSPMICFSEYAITRGINVAGGAQCATSQEKAEEVAEFGLGAGGACGPHPKEQPVVDGNWLTLAVWGIPETTASLKVGLGNGTDVEIDVRDGVALHIWEGRVDITSITFEGMTQAQEQLISSFLPIEGISDDCNQSDGAG